MPSNRQKTGTFWSRTLDTARLSRSWVVVPRSYSAATAKQLTADIRTAHRRKRGKMCNHVRPGERWDARYVIPDDKAEAEWNCKVLLKPINAPTKDN